MPLYSPPPQSAPYPPPHAENPDLLKVLSLKPGVGQNIAMHASPTVRNVSLSNHFSPSRQSVLLILSTPFLSLRFGKAGSSVGPPIKTGHPA